jgi:hypothetical protein
MAQGMRSPFEQWLLDNYGFEPDIRTPIRYRPPLFVDSDGMFDVRWHDAWEEQMRMLYEKAMADGVDPNDYVSSISEAQ